MKSIQILYTFSAASLGIAASINRWIKSKLKKPARRIEASRGVIDIESMPDWLLHDLGLTRSGMRINLDGMPLKYDLHGRLR